MTLGSLPIQAEAVLLSRLKVGESLLSQIPDSTQQPEYAVRKLDALADLATRRGRIAYSAESQRLEEAFTYWNEAEKLYQRASQTAGDLNQRYNERNRGLLQFTLASGLRKAKRLDEALVQSEAYINLCRVLRSQQDTPTAQRDLVKGLILGFLSRRSLAKSAGETTTVEALHTESRILLDEAMMISEELHQGDPEDVRSLELWAESHYNFCLLQFDRGQYEVASGSAQELITHVRSEHRRGVQNRRTSSILKAAIDLQEMSNDRQ